MQHPKLLDIEYAANLRVHLGAKIAAHFSKIAFPVRPKFRNTLILLMLTDGQITLAHTTSRPTATPPAALPPVNRRTHYTFVCGN